VGFGVFPLAIPRKFHRAPGSSDGLVSMTVHDGVDADERRRVPSIHEGLLAVPGADPMAVPVGAPQVGTDRPSIFGGFVRERASGHFSSGSALGRWGDAPGMLRVPAATDLIACGTNCISSVPKAKRSRLACLAKRLIRRAVDPSSGRGRGTEMPIL
jgi:hypothetical protein